MHAVLMVNGRIFSFTANKKFSSKLPPRTQGLLSMEWRVLVESTGFVDAYVSFKLPALIFQSFIFGKSVLQQ